MNNTSNWIPTQIENLQHFDVIQHSHGIWVINKISKSISFDMDTLEIHVTRVDDGKIATWKFGSFSRGYLITRLQRTY